MLYYIAYCLNIFFIILEVFVLLYVLKNMLPFSMALKGLIDVLAMPVLMLVQKIVKHSVLRCFKVDISPYIALIVFFYLSNFCSYLMEA